MGVGYTMAKSNASKMILINEIAFKMLNYLEQMVKRLVRISIGNNLEVG